VTSMDSFLQSEGGLLALLFVALAVGLAAGYAIRGRGRKKSLKAGTISVSESFLRGLNYLIHNDQDKAIQEFTRAVKIDSDTVETYVALGNLYRSKGEIERAVRVRQSIILRQGVDEGIRRQALFDLALDYRKGGLVDRAIATFDQILKVDPSNLEVYKQLEWLYEETRDWAKASAMRQKISKLQGTDDRNILAHYYTEQGKISLSRGDNKRAEDFFNKAIAQNINCVDAYLHLADLYLAQDDFYKALSPFKRLGKVAPEMCYLALDRLERLKLDDRQEKEILEFIDSSLRGRETPFVRLSIARYYYSRGQKSGALAELKAALSESPRFMLARKLLGVILEEEHRGEESIAQYHDLLALIEDNPRQYQCSKCGYTSSELTWKCPQCLRWDTIRHTDIKK